MRGYYASDTLRNFSMFGAVRMEKDGMGGFEELVRAANEKLAECTKAENLEQMMTLANRLVKSLCWIPLFIKRPVTRTVYGILGDRVFTTVLSNLGVLRLPKGLEDYVEKADAVIGTPITNRASCSMVTCGGKAVLAVTKLTRDDSFERALCRQLEALGLEFVLSGSEIYGC